MRNLRKEYVLLMMEAEKLNNLFRISRFTYGNRRLPPLKAEKHLISLGFLFFKLKIILGQISESIKKTFEGFQ